MKSIFLFLCALTFSFVAEAGYRLYNVVPMFIGHETEQAAKCVELYERTGEDLALYSLTLHPEGRPAVEKVDRYVASYRAFARALRGSKVRPAILVQSILGHWPRADKDIESWERTVDQNGKIVRFCPLDPGFCAYIDDVFRKLAAEKPSFILTDDDVRAYSHGAECFCPSHVKLFNSRQGTAYTTETLRTAVAKAKPGEAVYENFLLLQREMMLGVVERMRRAIDSVDPTIPAGICVAGEEHYLCASLARAIAARGQKPVMRCSTGLYNEGMSAAGFPSAFGRMLGFAEYYRDAGIELLDEADTCPQNLWSKSAQSFLTHLVASCFVGLKGAKTWYVNGIRATGIPVSRAYTDILAEHRGMLGALAEEVALSEPVGLAVPCLTNHPNWHVVKNHDEFFIERRNASFATVPFGVPFCASADFGRRDQVLALTTAEEVARLSDADLNLILSGKTLIFRDAAVALTRRGFADLTGVSAEKKSLLFTSEHDNVQGASLSYASATSGSVSFTAAAGAERLCDFVYAPYAGAAEDVVAPSTVFYRNRLGGETLVAAYHPGMFFLHAFSEGRKRWLVNGLDRLSGATLATVCGNDQHVLMSERIRKDGTRLVLAVNLNPEPISRLSLRIPQDKIVEVLSTDGQWRRIAGQHAGEYLSLPVPVAFYQAVVVRIRTEDMSWGKARWVWPHALGNPTNRVVEFRKTFLSSRAGEAKLKIAADTVYAVRLNGGELITGRFPDVPPMRFFDTRTVPGLRAGTNELTIALYVQGIGTFQHIAGDPGLMFALEGEDVRAVSDRELSWRISRRHHADHVPLVTQQLGFSFDYDAAADEDAWQKLRADDDCRGPADFELRPRPVPPVEVLPPVDERVIAQGALDGSPVPALNQLAQAMDSTVMRPADETRFFAADGRSVRGEYFKDGFYFLVDLGREEVGLLQLEVETDAGVTIDIGHAEHMQGGRIQTAIGKRCFAGRYRTAEGRNEFCRWERRMAGRYLQVHVRGVRSSFRLNRLTVRPTLFPLVERPMPSGLDSVRQEIWKTAVRTLRLCMHEHYEDCPWREQALYANDARNQMLSGYFAFTADNRMPELSLELLSKGLDENGWLEMCMPSKCGLSIPSFTFSWVLALGDHLAYRHDLVLIRSLMPVLRKIMDARAGELVDGLLPCPRGKRYWQFYDWEKDLSGGSADNQFDAPLNLFAVLAFESAARCAEAVAAADEAARWRAAADQIRSAVRAKFWNEDKQQIETRLGASLAPAELSQALALLAHAIPDEACARVAEKLSRPSNWTKTSLSQSLYKYEALRQAGGAAERAMWKDMDETWSAMLRAGATSFWEVSEGWEAFKRAGSLCHGWSAIPVYFYGTGSFD